MKFSPSKERGLKPVLSTSCYNGSVRFRYIVYDRKKRKERSGYITADSVEDAQSRLAKRGAPVRRSRAAAEETKPAEEAKPSDNAFGLVFLSKKREALVARAAGEYRPFLAGTLLSYRLPNLALMAPGLLLLPLSWGRLEKRHLSKEGYHEVEPDLEAALIVVGGKLQTSKLQPGRFQPGEFQPGKLQPDQLQVTVRFPQIPYSLDCPGQEVVREKGTLRGKVKLASRELPGYYELTVRGQGLKTKTVPRVLLEGDSVRIPAISLHRDN